MKRGWKVAARGLSSPFVFKFISPSAKKKWAVFFFVFPGIALFLLFWVYPIVKGFQISFYKWSINPNLPSIFIGLANYQRALRDPVFWLALRNTVLYMAITVPGQIICALIVAVLLDRIKLGRVFFRTVYYLPVITSWVIVSVLFRYLFAEKGLINYLLTDLLHLMPPIPWFTKPGTALTVIMLLGIWKGIGWSMVIFLAALQTIPNELYEAARIDGANAWHEFWRITLPLLRPTMVFVLVMLVIGGFNVFISVQLITGGGPLNQTEVILSYMYKNAFSFLDFGYAASLSYLLATLIFVITLLQLKFLRKPTEMYY
jgi:multiple sugar transport system permease protein